MKQYILTVQCRPSTDTLAAICSYLSDTGCRIIESPWIDSDRSSRFFIRLAFHQEGETTLTRFLEGFAAFADRFQIEWDLHNQTERAKTLYSVLSSALRQAVFAGALRTADGCRP
ncbi:hypothetical protein CK216_22855 [Mesorhizobium sp. WSM3876]|nr:hypothetical protein CK216_22855 [Mesorhizobium sp. WSM3876]